MKRGAIHTWYLACSLPWIVSVRAFSAFSKKGSWRPLASKTAVSRLFRNIFLIAFLFICKGCLWMLWSTKLNIHVANQQKKFNKCFIVLRRNSIWICCLKEWNLWDGGRVDENGRRKSKIIGGLNDGQIFELWLVSCSCGVVFGIKSRQVPKRGCICVVSNLYVKQETLHGFFMNSQLFFLDRGNEVDYSNF